MDTPDKNQTRTASLSKFEDSPVFHFINSLSPIKPVKSTHIAQTFNSISFPALPSILHISPHRELKSPRRPNHSDPTKSVSPSKDETSVSTDEGKVAVMDQLPEIFVPEVSFGNETEDSNSVFKLPENIRYGRYGAGSDPIVEECSEKVMLEDEGNMERRCQHGKITEGAALDWESSISDAAELLIFSSSINTEAVELIQKPYQITGFSTSHLDPVVNNVGQTADLIDPLNPNGFVIINSVNTTDDEVENCLPFVNKPTSSSHRGLRRRCLDFEMVGMPERTADDGSKHSSNEKLVSPTSSDNSFRCTLPGVGLHLNALATTFQESKHSNSENLSSDGQLSLPSCSAPFNTPHSSQEPLLTSGTSEREEDEDKNGLQLDEDASQESAHLLGEELNQINSKKNRQWMENAGKFGACKRCNCKKSRCLKLYCECFAAGVYCIEPCSCQECFNKPIHEDVVLETRRQIESRNPLAFAPKVIVNSDSVSELGDDSNKTPASARHKRGCNCKKSSCLKKYCECYQGGVGCSDNCRCEGCKNAFGRKDGSAPTGTETEQEEEEREIYQKSAETQNEEGQQNRSCAASLTPPGPRRSLIPLPFQLKRKLPSSFLDDRSSSRLSVRFKLEKQSVIQTQPKFEKNMHTTCEEEVPEILCMDCSSGADVKTVSPNSKRVALPPPQCGFGPSPSTRIGRKLILQSIPSFPSLTPQNSRVNGVSKL